MKRYVIIEQVKNGDRFETYLYPDTNTEIALYKIRNKWDFLSMSDKRRLEYMMLIHCELDEEGCPDMDTADIIKTYDYASYIKELEERGMLW